MNFGPIPEITREELLKRTTSRCPVCHAACPAEVWRVAGTPSQVFLKRTCSVHGEASACIASDARFYWLAQGNPANACCAGGNCGSPADTSSQLLNPQFAPGLALSAADNTPAGTLGRNAGGKGAGPFEKLSTCLALIEIVNSCNLACPTCYADSPVGAGHHVDAVPLADLQRRIQGVIDRKGGIEILQLSGGEPTLHPQFFELVAWIQAHPGIDYLLLNTNGVRIVQDEAFARQLAAAARHRHFQLYLQFDGPQLAGQQALRGADLRSLRLHAIERCGEMDLPITLAMTVTSENLPHLWEAIEFGLQFPHIRGISFQPLFGSGRLPGELTVRSSTPTVVTVAPGAQIGARTASDSLSPQRSAGRGLGRGESQKNPISPGVTHLPTPPSWGEGTATPPQRLNTADIILAAVEQSSGQLRFEDFTPLPCGDPNCATIGYLLKVNGHIQSVSDFIDFTQVQGFLHDKVRYRLEDLMQCGCESEPLGDLLKKFELNESNTFRLFIKPFMDAWTWDEDRIDRCCTHVIRPDGKLDSFCRYYSGFADARPAP